MRVSTQRGSRPAHSLACTAYSADAHARGHQPTVEGASMAAAQGATSCCRAPAGPVDAAALRPSCDEHPARCRWPVGRPHRDGVVLSFESPTRARRAREEDLDVPVHSLECQFHGLLRMEGVIFPEREWALGRARHLQVAARAGHPLGDGSGFRPGRHGRSPGLVPRLRGRRATGRTRACAGGTRW